MAASFNSTAKWGDNSVDFSMKEREFVLFLRIGGKECLKTRKQGENNQQNGYLALALMFTKLSLNTWVMKNGGKMRDIDASW